MWVIFHDSQPYCVWYRTVCAKEMGNAALRHRFFYHVLDRHAACKKRNVVFLTSPEIKQQLAIHIIYCQIFHWNQFSRFALHKCRYSANFISDRCMYVCMGFYGTYNYSGLVRQVPGFITVSVSAWGTCRNLDSIGFKDGGKPHPRTCETAALQKGIQKASRT